MLQRLKGWLNHMEEGFIALLLVSMTLLVVMDVVMRFGFGTGFLWSQELTLTLSAWFVLFGISYGLKVGAHIGVDAVVKLFPSGGQRLITIFAVLLSLLYCGLFIYGSWIYLHAMYQSGIGMEDLMLPQWFVADMSEEQAELWGVDPEDPLLPIWMSQSILIIGFSLFSLRLLELLWALIKGEASGFRHANEAKESLEMIRETLGCSDQVGSESSDKAEVNKS